MARRLKFKKKQLSSDDIPTASFSDLAFLLIIFFLLTATLQKYAGFRTEFPAGEKSQAQQEKVMTVALHDGRISFNDQDVTMTQLRTRLLDAKLAEKTGDAKVVVLSAAGNVAYQYYFETMALISAAGGVVAIEREETKAKK